MLKYIILSVLTICLGGCGNGGGTTPTASTTGQGTVGISLVNSQDLNKMVASALPSPTQIKILVFNSNYEISKDITLPAATATLPVLAGNGYTVYAVSYYEAANGAFTALKNGRADNISVVAGQNTAVNLTLLQPALPIITLPASTTANTDYNLTVSGASSSLTDQFSVMQSLAPINEAYNLNNVNPGNNNQATTIKALNTAAAGSMYLQIVFHDRLLLDHGGYGMVYCYPNPNFGDPQKTVPISPPSGGTAVNITY